MGKIFLLIDISAFVFISILSIMSAALLSRLSKIKLKAGILAWSEVHLVDHKTLMGCSVEDLLGDLRLSLRGFLIAGILLLLLFFALRKVDTLATFDRILVYIGFIIFLIFTLLSVRLNVRSASLLISNVINRQSD
jgi:hypothetical protein